MRVGGVVTTQRAQKRKHVLANHREHLGGRDVLEARPAERLVRQAAVLADVVCALRKDAPRHRPLEARRLVLLQRVQVVEPTQKEQVGDLLHHLERIGNPAGPKRVPDLVDL